MNVNDIKFGESRPATIFSDIADMAAKMIKEDPKINKNTQLRKFYDELAMWNDKVQISNKNKEAEYKKLEPFIKMLKAKVAYAEARTYVNQNFSSIFNKCIDQITSPDTLKDAKFFMEAVMGYCKLYEANNK